MAFNTPHNVPLGNSAPRPDILDASEVHRSWEERVVNRWFAAPPRDCAGPSGIAGAVSHATLLGVVGAYVGFLFLEQRRASALFVFEEVRNFG